MVTGLIAIGFVANAEGLFAAAGEVAAGLWGGPVILFVTLMLVVCLVTVVLNLDTSVTFLTPVLIAAARSRDLDERRLLYGCVFMSNAASLLLPGSNLTNLIVLRVQHTTAMAFASQMFPAWAVAVVATGAVTLIAFPSREARCASQSKQFRARIGAGAVGAALATALVIASPQPALPVLILGISVLGVALLRGTLGFSRLGEVADLSVLIGLLGLAVGLGAFARSWGGLSDLLVSASRWQTAVIGTGASLSINNLPAAVLLTAHAPLHPGALLLGLDLGPNMMVTGSLSAYLWFKVSTDAGVRPSIKTYATVGSLTAVCSIPLALIALTTISHV